MPDDIGSLEPEIRRRLSWRARTMAHAAHAAGVSATDLGHGLGGYSVPARVGSPFPEPGEEVDCADCGARFLFEENDWRAPGAPFCPSHRSDHQWTGGIRRIAATGRVPVPPPGGSGILPPRVTATPVPSSGRKKSG